MAYGTKYTATFDAFDGYEYQMQLDEKSWIGGVQAVLTYAGRGHTPAEWFPGPGAIDELTPGVMPADVSVSIYDENGTVASDIKAAGRLGYQIVLSRRTIGSAGAYTEYLRCYADPGENSRSLNRLGNITTIRGYDGLGELQEVTWEEVWGNAIGAGLAAGTVSITKAITRILDQAVGLGIPVRIASNWYHFKGDGAELIASDDPLDNTYIEKTKYNPDGERGSTYCDHVLRQLLGPFGLRLFQHGGYWWIVQYELLESSFTYWQYVFDYHTSGTAPTTATHDPALSLPSGTSEHLYRQTGGFAEEKDPYLSATVVHEHGALSGSIVDNPGFELPYNADGSANGWTKTGASLTFKRDSNVSEGIAAQFIETAQNTLDTPGDSAAAFDAHATEYITALGRAVPGGSGEGHKINFSVDVQGITGGGSHRFIFIEFKVGSYWMTSVGGWSASQQVLTWKVQTGPLVTLSKQANSEISATGDVSVTIYNPVATDGTNFTSAAGVRFDNLRIDYLPSGESDVESTTVVATDTSTTIATIYREEEAWDLGDSTDADGTLSTFLTSADLMTSDWGRGPQTAASGVSLHQLRARSIVELRANSPLAHHALHRADTSNAPIEITNTPVLGSNRFVPSRLVRTLDEGYSDYEIVEINRASPTISFSSRQIKSPTRARGGEAADTDTVFPDCLYETELTRHGVASDWDVRLIVGKANPMARWMRVGLRHPNGNYYDTKKAIYTTEVVASKRAVDVSTEVTGAIQAAISAGDSSMTLNQYFRADEKVGVDFYGTTLNFEEVIIKTVTDNGTGTFTYKIYDTFTYSHTTSEHVGYERFDAVGVLQLLGLSASPIADAEEYILEAEVYTNETLVNNVRTEIAAQTTPDPDKAIITVGGGDDVQITPNRLRISRRADGPVYRGGSVEQGALNVGTPTTPETVAGRARFKKAVNLGDPATPATADGTLVSASDITSETNVYSKGQAAAAGDEVVGISSAGLFKKVGTLIASLVTAASNIVNGNLAQGDGSKGLSDSGIAASAVSGHIASTSNPHSVTKTQVGLGSVENRVQQYLRSGTTAARPTPGTVGEEYFDTDLGKPIWHNGTNWVDATGTTV